MNRNIWAIWISMVVSFVMVLTFTLMMMYVSPSGIVCVYENNLLIRDSEIVIGIFTTIVSVYIFGKVTFTNGKDLVISASNSLSPGQYDKYINNDSRYIDKEV